MATGADVDGRLRPATSVEGGSITCAIVFAMVHPAALSGALPPTKRSGCLSLYDSPLSE